jgi:diguanylate cyclase (GGDEF)-like protein/PAS domain S-box-containing protein
MQEEFIAVVAPVAVTTSRHHGSSMDFPFPSTAGQGGPALDQRAPEAVRDGEELRFAFEHAAISMCLTEAGTGRFLRVNPAFCELTGYSKDEVLSLSFGSLTHPDDVAASMWLQRQALENGTRYRMEKRYLRKDGSEIWVRVVANPVRDDRGKATCFIGLVEDITDLRAAKESARRNEERWQLALQGTSDGIWDWDVRTGQVFFSARWKEMLGFADHDLPNNIVTWEKLVHPDDLIRVKATVRRHLRRLTPGYEAEYRLRCLDGHYKWILARGRAVWDASGNPTRMVGAHSDITERKKAEEQLVFNAEHDALTGLVNRRCLRAKLDQNIAGARSAGRPFCLAICDIDSFKSVNDAWGHPAGDEVLVAFARLLREPEGLLAGRLGGDEFCVLLPGATREEAIDALDQVRERLAAITFSTDAGVVFNVTGSVGIALLEPGMTSHGLMAAADDALYVAKKSGRNRVQVSDRESPLTSATL